MAFCWHYAISGALFLEECDLIVGLQVFLEVPQCFLGTPYNTQFYSWGQLFESRLA